MALELALDIGKAPLKIDSFSESDKPRLGGRLGSVISVCAGLISFPSSSLDLETPIGFFTRQNQKSQIAQKTTSTVKRAFKKVVLVQAKGTGEDMPKGKEEWEGLMRFWSEVLIREEGWKGDGEVFEVIR